MAVTRAGFLARHPSFENVTVTVVDAAIAEAAAQVDTEILGAKADACVMMLTAHLLAVSQFGRHGKMMGADGTTPYLLEFRRLLRASMSTGFVV